VYDRLGQTLFADNTYVASIDPPPGAQAGQVLVASLISGCLSCARVTTP
jgi:lipopolysaccharide transport system ATP-binding protein